MGSCVSHCSRQDIVHQQTGSVISDVHSIEDKTGTAMIQKRFTDFCSDTKISETGEVREQINAELRALREQLVRSQVLFTYLLKTDNSGNAKNLEDKKELYSYLEGGALGDAIFQCKSFDGQVLARLYCRSNRSSSSYTSHRSTPLHYGYTSLSCPTLPIDCSVVTKSTQTEPIKSTMFYDNEKKMSSHSLNKVFMSPPSTPSESHPIIITDICDVHQEAEEHSYPRHRTNSFLSAVKEGNFKNIISKADNTSISFQYDTRVNQYGHVLGNYNTDSNTMISSSTDELEERIINEKETAFPRKLSILLEEDPEDASGNFHSICDAQFNMNRKRKIQLSLCNAKTQTEFLPFKPIKQTTQLPIAELCFPRTGFVVVSQFIKKKTVHSEELPPSKVLRHPPPYLSKQNRHRHFKTHQSKYAVKSQMYKWATVSGPLSSQLESSQNMNQSFQMKSKLETRHLSLEKQESFASSWCTDSSRLSSTTDCSSWFTKSDLDLNQRPNLPSYQEIISQKKISKHSSFSDLLPSSKSTSERNCAFAPPIENITEIKAESEIKLNNDSDENNKEKSSKVSPRRCSGAGLRRGSGAGSPNSQLSIPRYPAFDFSEAEDSVLQTPTQDSEKKVSILNEEDSHIVQESNKSEISEPLKQISKRRESGKLLTLMPEFMETSETESTKGSFEYEVPDLPFNSDSTSATVADLPFPSLPNTFLAKLGVHKDSPLPVEQFDEHELESKFVALSLAFKTDTTTLNKRIELHKRQRDVAERNVENEFQTMRDHLNTLNLKATNSDIRDIITKIQNHLDIAQLATSRASGRSETYGAVQQEERVSRAFEVLVLHVDHLKRLFDREHKELEDTRRILSDTNLSTKDTLETSVATEDQIKYSKSLGLPVGSVKSFRKPIVQISES